MTRDQLIEVHGEELGDAIWMCAMIGGDTAVVFEAVADRDPLAARRVDFLNSYEW